METVAVGLSGGVDSALTAYLLKQEGYNVIGITMSTYDGSIEMPVVEGRDGCFGPNEHKSIAAAKEVAKRLGIEHFVVPISEAYKKHVIEYFRREYRSGRTPNPCVRCNQAVKFGAMLLSAKQMGINFDYFATGHYARLDFKSPEEPFLYQAIDESKDQSYFLSRLSFEQLSMVKFPLGDKRKQEIKELARQVGFADYATKKESQDFLECGDYSVLFDESDNVPGNFVDLNGNILGQHKGIIHYTIGQRKGLNIGGQKEPLFVVSIDAKNNTVVLGPREKLSCLTVKANDLNLLVDKNSPLLKSALNAKIRLGHKGAKAFIKEMSETEITIQFEEVQFAATPGQILVLYAGEGIVASAVIC